MLIPISFYRSNRVVDMLQLLLLKFSRATHVQIGADDAHDISAEASGVKIIDRIDDNLIVRFWIRAPKSLTLPKWVKLCHQYVGKKYNYAMYFTWFLRMSWLYAMVIMSVLAVFGIFSFYTSFLGVWVWTVVSRVLGFVLERLGKDTWNCSGLTAKLLWWIGINFGIDRWDATIPDQMMRILMFAYRFGDEVQKIELGEKYE